MAKKCCEFLVRGRHISISIASERGCLEATLEMVRQGCERRTDDGFRSGLDNKSNMERVTTPELEADGWGTDTDGEMTIFGSLEYE